MPYSNKFSFKSVPIQVTFSILKYLSIEIQLALELHVLQYYIGLYQARYNTLCILSMYRKETARFRIPRSTILHRSV